MLVAGVSGGEEAEEDADGSLTTEMPDWRISSSRKVISVRLRSGLNEMSWRRSFCSSPLRWKYLQSRISSARCWADFISNGYPRSRWRSSEKVLADRFGTEGGRMEGGRRSPSRSRPGKTSVGVLKKTAKPREK